MYRHLERRITVTVREFLRGNSFLNLPATAYDELPIVVEKPPRPEMGDYALPLAFALIKLAKKHGTYLSHPRKHPNEISRDVAEGLRGVGIEGIAAIETAGVGYINFRIDRGWLAAAPKRS